MSTQKYAISIAESKLNLLPLQADYNTYLIVKRL
jgi:hypothetical protein